VYALLLVYTTLLSITTEILTFFARPVNTGMTTHRIHGSDAQVVPAAFPNLWQVSNCFDSETFEWLKNLPLAHNERWHRDQDCLEYRLQLTTDSESHAKLRDLSASMTGAMEQIVGRSLRPTMNKVWLDLPYFHCPYHADADLLMVTYQVYLWGYGGSVYGTAFCELPTATIDNPGQEIEMPFEPNTGYINLNIDQKVHHARNCDGIRLSACFQWQAA
jgi:hypothetical protein